MKRTKITNRILAGIFVACLLVLCLPAVLRFNSGGGQNQITMYEDDVLMKKELLKQIPVGSKISRAKSILDKNSFSCTMLVDSRFVKNRSFAQAEKVGGKASLRCLKDTNGRDWLGYKTGWAIEVLFRNGKVTGINVSHTTNRWFNCCL